MSTDKPMTNRLILARNAILPEIFIQGGLFIGVFRVFYR